MTFLSPAQTGDERVVAPDVSPSPGPEAAGGAGAAGALGAGITRDGISVIGAQAEAEADDIGLAEADERRPDPDLGAAKGRLRAGLDGLLHGPDKTPGRVRIVGRILDVKAADELPDPARLGPGGGQGQEDAVAERDVGRGRPLFASGAARRAGEGNAGIRQGGA